MPPRIPVYQFIKKSKPRAKRRVDRNFVIYWNQYIKDKKEVVMVTIEIVAGCMFSGKTEELIRRCRRAQLASQNVVCIKPKTDTRSALIASRRKKKNEGAFETCEEFPATSITSLEELKALLIKTKPDVLGGDEVQFFGRWFFWFLRNLKQRKDISLRVILAGLDMDAWGRPFGIMPHLLAIADHVQKVTAVCFQCKNPDIPATMSQKISQGTGERIEIGDQELYEARCLRCWTPPRE